MLTDVENDMEIISVTSPYGDIPQSSGNLISQQTNTLDGSSSNLYAFLAEIVHA